MKKFFVAALVLCSAVVNAAEVTVLDKSIILMNTYRTIPDARFQMDKASGEGFVKVTVEQERQTVIYNYPGSYPGPHYPGRYPYPGDHRMPQVITERFTVFEDMVKVEGLALVGDKVMYHGVEGAVDCGTMGVSRVFKVPTIYLNGNCKLTSRIANYSRVVVKLQTK